MAAPTETVSLLIEAAGSWELSNHRFVELDEKHNTACCKWTHEGW
jgi:hypothetical protein